MKVDPADPRLIRDANNQGGDTPAAAATQPRWDPQEPTKQCWICDVQVGEKSMHCKFCNKCIDHFDHHCMWLNTCVGKANYHYFFRTMISIAIMLFVQAVIQLALILDIYLGNGATKQRSEEWFQADATIAVVIVMGIFLFFDLGALSLIGQLLLFHLKLQREGISTYQYIVRDNQRRREQTKKENDLKLRRQMAIAHAKQEGNSLQVMRLEKGGWIRESCGLACCDPLQLEEEENGDKRTQNERPNGGTPGLATSNGHPSNATAISGPYDDDEEETKEPDNV